MNAGAGTISVIEPATAEEMASVERAGAEDVDAAVARAKDAFAGWRRVTPEDRSAMLHALSSAISDRQEELATLEARNAGKPISDARGEIGMVAECFRYYAAAPQRLLGDTIPVSGGVDMTFREPLGVVGMIVPWNFPLVISSWKVAPALAAGNTVVLKPAELTPLSALELERIAVESGIPKGVLNVVAGKGSVAGQRLVEHADVAKVAFTGSTEVGRGIAQAAAATIKRVTLELGESRPTSSSPTPTSRPPLPRRPAASSVTRARTAARARGSWSSAPRSTSSWATSRAPSRTSRSAIRWRTAPRWAP